MKRLVFFLGVLIFNCCFLILSADQEVFSGLNLSLKTEILEMCDKDQEIRDQWINARGTEVESALSEMMMQIDDHHLIREKEIISLYGWPGFTLIGQEGSHAFWLLIQHTYDLKFQKQCLILLEHAVSNQEASIIDFAYLTDRVLMYEGKKQIYGTQFHMLDNMLILYPIEDENDVDVRRKAIGLCSLQEYIELVHQVYKIETGKSNTQ